MAYIQLHDTLLDHPKLSDLADELEGDPALSVIEPEERVALALLRLWLWSLTNSDLEGDLSKFRPRALSKAAGWKGDPDRFRAALVASGWLDPDGKLHDWEEYAGSIMVKRRKRALEEKARRDRRREELASLVASTDNPRGTHVAPTCQPRDSLTERNGTEINRTEPEDKTRGRARDSPPAHQTPEKPKKSPRKKTGKDAEIPASLDCTLFRAAWEDWLSDRSERRKPVTLRAGNSQLARLAKVGTRRAIDTIRVAIERGWQGLDPDWADNVATNKQPKPKPAAHLAGGQPKRAGPAVWKVDLARYPELSPGDSARVDCPECGGTAQASVRDDHVLVICGAACQR